MARHPNCASIPPDAKARLRILLLAKHARGNGRAHATDGNHAVYHHELRTTLEHIGLNVVPVDSFEALDDHADVDFAIPLLNRAGFQNSEMLGPLLLAHRGIPFLGASAILRGLADDKHLTKLAAVARGVPTMDWQIHRRGSGRIAEPHFAGGPMIVKPNASSASWGIRVSRDWNEAEAHIYALQEEGHDVIVEPYVPLFDVAVPVIAGISPEPWLLPPLAYMPEHLDRPRSYEEKRALVDAAPDPLFPIEDAELVARLSRYTRTLAEEFWPFDYGRFEFRYDPAADMLQFMEVNLSCNLSSQKTISRSAALIGIDHAALVETIVAHSLHRRGLLAGAVGALAA